MAGRRAGEALPDEHPLFDLLLIDEISRLKSPASKRARALLPIAARFRNRWGLTGTPRPNGEQDLFMPAAVITAGACGAAASPLAAATVPADRLQRLQMVDQAGMGGAHGRGVRPIAITLDEDDMPDLPEINKWCRR